jgi:hypothetical protein
VHCEHAEHESLTGARTAVQPEEDSLHDAQRDLLVAANRADQLCVIRRQLRRAIVDSRQ